MRLGELKVPIPKFRSGQSMQRVNLKDYCYDGWPH